MAAWSPLVTSAALVVLTFLTVTTLAPVWYLAGRGGTDLVPVLSPSVLLAVWADPELLSRGLQFSLPALFILLAHESGHYLACRHHGVAATLPRFLPAPFGVGTLGAFIRLRSQPADRRQLLDIALAGPLAGVVALLPFLLIGLKASRPAELPPVSVGDASLVFYPGQSLLMWLLSRWFFGPVATLDYHPFAFASWFGLLVTSLNLLPLGQLDGGHVAYAALGKKARWLALPTLLTLVALALTLWAGWWAWVVLVFLLGRRHPPTADDSTPLGAGRRLLAWVALLLFFLVFMPRPVVLY